MELRKLKSIGEASDRDMLNFIFATQLQILRRLDRIEQLPAEEALISHRDTTKDMVDKVDTFINRINDYMREG